jgi:endonuclease YncB( thermonuclease family)
MRNIPSLLILISLSRDRSFHSTPKIGHELAKQPVTIDRNHRSRLSEMTGHDGPKYAHAILNRFHLGEDLDCGIRLMGIDAPEKKQAFGQKSKENLSELIYNKQVTVEYNKRDR